MPRRSGTGKRPPQDAVPGRRSAPRRAARDQRPPPPPAPPPADRNDRAGLRDSAGHGLFYASLLRFLSKTRIRFMVGGTCAVNVYVAHDRKTKDLDIFCRPGDYPRLLKACADAGYQTQVEDERWIAKVSRGRVM